MFAEMLCDDLELNPGVFVNPISSTIRAQIEQTNSDNTNKEVFKEAHDRRVIIKLNIQVGNTNLIDQFEWDMADNKNCPEYRVFKIEKKTINSRDSKFFFTILFEHAVFLKSSMSRTRPCW